MEPGSFDLTDLKKLIGNGEMQIPDFQRGWVWNDEQIKSLLESVVRGFPINSILLLEYDANSKKFSCEPIKGVSPTAAPKYLILDGQQRLTSLYCALCSQEPAKFTDGDERYYYLDINKAIRSIKNAENVEDMIISVPKNRKIKLDDKVLDLSDAEKEYAADMFPLNKLFEGGWVAKYISIKSAFGYEFFELIFNRCREYKVAYIQLEKDMPIALVCKIFEKVNTGGTELTVFELLTAILAACQDDKGDRINLPSDWKQIEEKFSAIPILKDAVNSTYFVTALTLLATYEKDVNKKPSCKRDDILNLTGSDYLKYKDCIVDGFIEAAKFLDGQCIRKKDYLPYPTQLIPLAAIYAELKLRGINPLQNKIQQWYWCGVFGESYRAAQETRYGRDLAEVIDWLDKDTFPKIISETQMSAARLLRFKARSSAAFKGIMSLIFRNKAKDFLTGKVMSTAAAFEESIDVHHIFPKNYCKAHGFNAEAVDTVANRTPISAKTNRIISDNAPNDYLNQIADKTGFSSEDLDKLLETHFANAELCRADNFDAFIVDRAKKILDEIEQLTGRPISDRDSQDIIAIFGEPL